MDQVAVRRMDLHHLEPGADGPGGGFAPGLDHGVDVGLRHLPRHRMALLVRDGAGADQLPLAATGHRGCDLERPAPFPGPRIARLAAGMAELDAGHGAELLDEAGDPLERFDEAVVPQAGIGRRGAAARVDLGRLHEHQAASARRILAQMHEVPVADMPVHGGVGQHGRQHDPVLQLHAADAHGSEQLGIHCALPRCRLVALRRTRHGSGMDFKK